LSIYFLSFDYARLDPTEMVKGIVAGLSLRFCMYCGLLLALDNTNVYLDAIKKWIQEWIITPL
jgi:hypothetical protein